MGEYKIYLDESGFCSERFQSICAISGSNESLSIVENSLREILIKNNISDLHFSDVGTHSSKLIATDEFLLMAVEYVSNYDGRIDILLWDTQDERHSIFGRDDVANFHRMFYRLISFVARKYNQTIWEVYPDENTSFNWNEIEFYLSNSRRNKWENIIQTLFDEFNPFFKFEKITQVSSINEPIVQLADIFAGIGRFSVGCKDDYKIWKSISNINQVSLFNDRGKAEQISKRTTNRFKLMKNFSNYCKGCSLGVSLNTNNFLKTFDKRNPINFWHYEKKYEYDFAPTR